MSTTQPSVAADEVRLDEAETVPLAYFQAAQRTGGPRSSLWLRMLWLNVMI